MNLKFLEAKIANWLIKWRFCILAIIRSPFEIYLRKKETIILVTSSLLITVIYFYEKGIVIAFLLALLISTIVIFYIYSIFDILFYSTFYDTQKYIKELSEGKTDRETLENFQINFDKLRILLKKRLKLLNRNLLIYDYKINNIMKNIDVFFDTTIQIFFEKHLMDVPFTPSEEYRKLVEWQEFNETLKHEIYSNEEDDSDYADYNIKNIDYESISKFLGFFRRKFINSSMPPIMNIYAIEKFFENWNEILELNEKKTFDKTKENIFQYYMTFG